MTTTKVYTSQQIACDKNISEFYEINKNNVIKRNRRKQSNIYVIRVPKEKRMRMGHKNT